MIDFVTIYLNLVNKGLPIEKVPEKYREQVSAKLAESKEK